MLRQFHVEGFANLYALNRSASTPKHLLFESEYFENFNNSWKAKETYDIISPDEFIETFELAPPGKPFEVYSRNHLKRAPHSANSSVRVRVREGCGLPQPTSPRTIRFCSLGQFRS